MTRTRPYAVRLAAVAAAAALTLTGCSAYGGSDDSDSGSSEAGDTSEGVVNGDSVESAKAAGVDLQNPPEPIGAVTIEVDQDRIDTTKVELLQLRERGKVMLAVFRVTPEGSTTEDVRLYDALGGHSFEPWLLDLENLKGYSNISDLTTSDTGYRTVMGEPLYAFTAFPIPDGDVETVDVKILSAVPAIEDVPLP